MNQTDSRPYPHQTETPLLDLERAGSRTARNRSGFVLKLIAVPLGVISGTGLFFALQAI